MPRRHRGTLDLKFGNPAIIANALDPWLCVPAFQQVCPKLYIKLAVQFDYVLNSLV